MADRDDLLQGFRDEHADPVYLKSKAEYVEYYRETYGKNWTRAAAEALSGTTDHKSREYKAAIRQFQGERLHQAGPRLAPRYEAVGKQLPPSSYNPKGDITITVKGTQSGGARAGGTRDRSFTATFTGSDAYGFVNNPNFRDVYRAMGYPEHVIDKLEEGDYEIDVSSVS